MDRNKEKIKYLYDKNNKCNTEKDIIYEMNNQTLLKSERLKILIKLCTPILNTSSSLIKRLMKENSKEILEILFKNHYRFIDRYIIIDFLNYYKNQIPISTVELFVKINNEKYTISTDIKKHYNYNYYFYCSYQYNSYYYLFNVCESGNKAALKFLLEHGANINIENIEGETPLFTACKNGNTNLVQYLVEKGADINKENRKGETPLFNPCSSENINLVQYLVEKGAKVNKKSYYDKTPLFLACKNGNEDLVNYLIDHIPDEDIVINKKYPEGKTQLIITTL